MAEGSDPVMELSGSDIEDSWILSESEFAQVLFSNTSESYAADADIECHFQLPAGFEILEGDQVGLYKIGWHDISSHITCQNVEDAVKLLSGKHNSYFLLFKAKDLPKDFEYYFQFCYITKDQNIRGASIPFKFRPLDQEELVVTQSDQESKEFLIVKSKQTDLEEKLRSALHFQESLQQNLEKSHECKEFLQSSLSKATVERNALEVYVSELEYELKDLRAKYRNLEKEIEESKTSTHEKTIEISRLKDFIKDKEAHCCSLQEILADITTELELSKNIQQSTMQKYGQFDQLVMELNETKSMIQAQEQTKGLLHQELRCKNEIIAQLSKRNEILNMENDALKQQLEVISTDKIKASSIVMELQTENQEVVQKLAAKEENLQMLANEKTAVSNEANELKARLSEGANHYALLYAHSEKLANKLKKYKKKYSQKNGTLSSSETSQNNDSETGELVQAKRAFNFEPLVAMLDGENQEFLGPTKLYEPLQTRSAPISATASENLIDFTADGPSRNHNQESTNDLTDANSLLISETIPKRNSAPADPKASSEIFPVPCPVCEELVAISPTNNDAMVIHLSAEHQQTPCPVCSCLFDQTLPDIYLQYHVQSHYQQEDVFV